MLLQKNHWIQKAVTADHIGDVLHVDIESMLQQQYDRINADN